MHPNVFLRSFWQLELRPEVFVAMTFSDEYRARFDEVIAPAIRSVQVGGVSLEPRRVDESRSGDSILTEIADGITHSQLVLADVSTLGRDSKSGRPYRNGNVMYEVGIALACRQPAEVLLIRDGQDRFLLDVSTIPHMTLDFTDAGAARVRLASELVSRLRERDLVHDALRAQRAADRRAARPPGSPRGVRHPVRLTIINQRGAICPNDSTR
ncbi:MAG: hypothetical protein FJX74_17330 [Armatimonadetes bacterium]|nr:hypothetical protein [Armatimonadota bacterium]